MDTTRLKKYAQYARRSLIEQIGGKLQQVLTSESPARRENPKAVADLEKQIQQSSENQVIESIAYVWFNRFCALRFMDVNQYNRIMVISPLSGQFQPEILSEAKAGYIEDALMNAAQSERVFKLLNGTAPSHDPQTEAYRKLIVAVCNDYHRIMPYLFQRIDDYTELLMPDNLLSGNSILAYTREAMTPEACKSVEVIGWLYQFYISEKKEDVFAGLKKNKKITPENIPAATQLFTPHWIVRYLVENSLGRLWMLNNPDSKVIEQMDYYIKPETSVGSGKWEVESAKRGVVNKEKDDGGEELPGVDCVAEGDGSGGAGLSGDKAVSEGRVVRTDESGAPSGSVDTVQHSRRTGAEIDSGIQPFSIDSPRVQSRGGDTNNDFTTARVHQSTEGRKNSNAIGRDQTDDLFTEREAQLASHSPLPTFFLRISSPEELKICDPACGSGHMLTYAYDLLYAMYLDAGYDPAEIPEKILTCNLYGIEIDERAAELAAFALTMKAVKGNPLDNSNNRRRFFRKPIKPNICRLEKIEFSDQELDEYIEFSGRDLFTADLRTSLKQFEEADNFGSLIQPVLTHVDDVLAALGATDVNDELFLKEIHTRVLKVLTQVDYLSPKYHVVVANPPYMGGKGMNARLGKWVKDHYPDSKSDLFATFIERGLDLVPRKGYSAMVTMQSWMFLSSYEKLRSKLMEQTSIEAMVHMGNMVMGIAFGTAATVWKKNGDINSKGGFCYVEYEDLDKDKAPVEFPPRNERNSKAIQNPDCGWFYRASATDFKKIPGSPVAYWISDRFRNIFTEYKSLGEVGTPRLGMATGNNDIYMRNWAEVSTKKIGIKCKSRLHAQNSAKKWFPYNKGGPFRRWYGNNEYLVNWENDGKELQNTLHPSGKRIWAHNFNLDYIFKPCLTFTATSSSYFGIRYSSEGFLFDNKGSSYFTNTKILLPILGFLASKPATQILKAINPTIEFQPGNISVLPFAESVVSSGTTDRVSKIVTISKRDWDSYEISWDFSSLPLLRPDFRETTLKDTFQYLLSQWQVMISEMKRLEEENNNIFIDAYGLQDEGNLPPAVPLKEITLTCNPHYRYSGNKTEDELEALLLADTMREFISYAVGCMFGRYSLDKEGLILANQGDTLADYYEKLEVGSEKCEVKSNTRSTSHFPLPTPHSFPPDDDNVIPLINFDGDWFEDDISERFKQFLKITFGAEHFKENLRFIEEAIGKDIKKFFIRDFYTDHIKRYKKRPIYWLFSSPKGTFNALIYLHRYEPGTASIVLNDYLREFHTKLTARKDSLEQIEISATASPKEKTQALRSIEKINKVLDEINNYEHDILYPLATQQIDIDLDDGVKANYPQFGKALKKVAGLSSK